MLSETARLFFLGIVHLRWTRVSPWGGSADIQQSGNLSSAAASVCSTLFCASCESQAAGPSMSTSRGGGSESHALLNRLLTGYAETHEAALRPRAVKIVALEKDEPEAKPVTKPAKRKWRTCEQSQRWSPS